MMNKYGHIVGVLYSYGDKQRITVTYKNVTHGRTISEKFQTKDTMNELLKHYRDNKKIGFKSLVRNYSLTVGTTRYCVIIFFQKNLIEQRDKIVGNFIIIISQLNLQEIRFL